MIKELAKIESRQKHFFQLIALLQNTSFDQENNNTSNEIGIENKINENEIDNYIHKHDVKYHEDGRPEYEYNIEGNIINTNYFS